MRIFIMSKKQLLISVSVGIIAIAFIIGSEIWSKQTAPASVQPKKLPIYCVKTEEKQIALTFDAAWGNSDTDQLINILKKHHAKATFFTTGEWVDKYPDDVKKLYQAGHDIQNHSDKHPHVADISADKLKKDTLSCDDKIEKLIGKRPTLYRAPYGEYDNDMMAVFENELKHFVIQWDVYSRDWKRPTVEKMVESVTKSVKPGSILLFHNDLENTPTALDSILTQLDKESYQYILVSELILKDHYMIDNNGMQIKK